MKMLLAGITSVILLITCVTTADAASVPSWVKNNAGWWADGTLAESDFVTGIHYLIEQGIM